MDIVHKSLMTFGTSGTQTSVTADSTSTTNRHSGPKEDYSVQLTCIATGTSGVGATCIWQASNDGNGWVNISSATASATQAGTSTAYASAGIAVVGFRYANVRAATIVVTGTGAATVTMGE